MSIRIESRVSACSWFLKTAIFLVLFFSLNTNVVLGDSASYFYDSLGRLERVAKGSSGTIYKYDELGNLISVTSAAITDSPPAITSINPNVLFVGQTLLVTITGQNLFTTESVTSNNGLLSINTLTVTDTQIVAEIRALSAGTDTIRVTTRETHPYWC